MFHSIPSVNQKRMAYLEECESLDRIDGTSRMDRLRQIPPDTGRYIALAAASAASGQIIEIGTTAGYSTLWLALAARETGPILTDLEPIRQIRSSRV